VVENRRRSKLKQVAELAVNQLAEQHVDELLTLAGVRRQTVVPRRIDMNGGGAGTASRIENLIQKAGAQIERPEQWPAASRPRAVDRGKSGPTT